jgi:hypothetical protein
MDNVSALDAIGKSVDSISNIEYSDIYFVVEKNLADAVWEAVQGPVSKDVLAGVRFMVWDVIVREYYA